jgi:hypothetical protein
MDCQSAGGEEPEEYRFVVRKTLSEDKGYQFYNMSMLSSKILVLEKRRSNICQAHELRFRRLARVVITESNMYPTFMLN